VGAVHRQLKKKGSEGLAFFEPRILFSMLIKWAAAIGVSAVGDLLDAPLRGVLACPFIHVVSLNVFTPIMLEFP
jgi:hypothetical protein